MPARVLMQAFAAFMLVCVASTPLPTLAQERVMVPGTTVSLTPHEGFELAQEFSGLYDGASGASLLIAEFPAAAYSELSRTFADPVQVTAGLSRQGMTLDDLSSIQIGSDTAPLIRARQSVEGVTFRKWLTILGGARTVLITVQAPPDANLDDEGVLTMLRSVSLGGLPTLSAQIGLLPFRASVVEPFRAASVLGGSALMMTAGPNDVDPSRSQPVIIIASGSIMASGDSRSEIAEAQLRATSALRDLEIESRQAATFAGMDAVVLEGVVENGARRFIQYLGFGEDGSQIRMIALAPSGSFASVEHSIRAIADSVRPAQ